MQFILQIILKVNVLVWLKRFEDDMAGKIGGSYRASEISADSDLRAELFTTSFKFNPVSLFSVCLS